MQDPDSDCEIVWDDNAARSTALNVESAPNSDALNDPAPLPDPLFAHDVLLENIESDEDVAKFEADSTTAPDFYIVDDIASSNGVKLNNDAQAQGGVINVEEDDDCVEIVGGSPPLVGLGSPPQMLAGSSSAGGARPGGTPQLARQAGQRGFPSKKALRGAFQGNWYLQNTVKGKEKFRHAKRNLPAQGKKKQKYKHLKRNSPAWVARREMQRAKQRAALAARLASRRDQNQAALNNQPSGSGTSAAGGEGSKDERKLCNKQRRRQQMLARRQAAQRAVAAGDDGENDVVLLDDDQREISVDYISIDPSPSSAMVASATHQLYPEQQQQLALAQMSGLPHPSKIVGLPRPVIIDGLNVAHAHGNSKFCSCRGIWLAAQHWRKNGHKVHVVIPRGGTNVLSTRPVTEFHLIEKLEEMGEIVYSPTRKIPSATDDRKWITIKPYDDRLIVQVAHISGGVIVSNDNYRDIILQHPDWADTIKNRVLMYTWLNDVIIFPFDPMGASGPSLDDVVRFPPGVAAPSLTARLDALPKAPKKRCSLPNNNNIPGR